MALAGITKLYVARLITDTASGLTYDTPRYYPQVQELSIEPTFGDDTAYGENRAIDTASEFGSATLGLNRYDMRSSEEAYLLGRDTDSAGGVIGSAGDDAPYVALLYHCPLRRLRANGARAERYGIIYKGRFNPPKIDAKTLEGKPDLTQTPQLSGTGIATDWFYTNASGVEKHPYEKHVDTDDENCPTGIADTWWTGASIPGVAVIAALALSSSTPAANATGVAVGAEPALTFNNAVSNYGGIALLKADGTTVTHVLSIDASSKVVTITPAEELDAATEYIIVVSGVTDIYGHILASQVVKFTTA